MDDATAVARATWSAFLRALNPGHLRYVEKAARCNGFVLGDHWREEDRKTLEKEGRPALTFNLVRPLVNAILGHFLDTQADIVLKPRGKGASEQMATVITQLIDIILDQNQYHNLLEPLLVADGLIEQRGYLDVRVDFETNILGDAKITVLDPRTVVLDPDAQSMDPSTWSEVFLDRWLSLDDVEAFYGEEVRKKILARVQSPHEAVSSRMYDVETFGGDGRNDHYSAETNPIEEKHIKSVRVVERQYRRRSLTREFVNPQTGAIRQVPQGWDEQRIKAVAETYGLFVRSRAANRVRWVVTAGDGMVLHDDWSPYEDFTIIPFFPGYRRGRTSGVVDDLIDPQEYLNKTESQTLHIINTTANSGWVVEHGSLQNMTEDELAERGASTGLVVVFGKGRTPPEKIQPNQIPTGLQNFASRAGEYITAISGAGGLGADPAPEVSGVQLERRFSNALLGLKPAMVNLRFTRTLLAKRLLSIIQRFYTEPRVFLATDWSDPELPQEEIAINQMVAGAIVNNVAPGDYDVVVTEAPARDTMEDKQFAEALQLREAGIPIPAYRVVLSSHLADKRGVAEEVRQLEGLGEPTEMDLMLQQLQLQRAQLELAELEAKIGELQARAMLQQSKAQQGAADTQLRIAQAVTKAEADAEKLRADIQKFEKNLENKLQLAQLHAGAKVGLTRYNQAMGAQQKERDRDAELQRTLIQTAAKQREAGRNRAAEGSTT